MIFKIKVLKTLTISVICAEKMSEFFSWIHDVRYEGKKEVNKWDQSKYVFITY